MKKKTLAMISALAILASLFAGCAKQRANSSSAQSGSSQQQETTVAKEPVTLTLAAASSLKNAFDEKLIPIFEKKYSWITVNGTYDSSGKLQTQIEEGLSADIFMSAADKQMNALTDKGFITKDSVTELLENKIVLIVPEGKDSGIKSFNDIGKAAEIAIGDPESVPAGQYAKEALNNLGLWDGIQGKVSLGTNVTEVLNWVAEGSAGAGIVYATDAKTSNKVKVAAEAPEGSLKTKIRYPVGIVAATKNQEAAELFLEFLKSDEAIKVFEDCGFTKGN
ncbi:MAG: molybdate ABC transporter substrate-binding protein [Bacillota bacterium]|nr:molybdate ABC transporter substrate-binding protein [Bacillota bacterium]